MVMDLREFNEPQKSDIAEFNEGEKKVNPLVNEATSANMAAQAAALSAPEEIERTYLKVNDELQYGASETVGKVADEYDRIDIARDTEVVRDMLSDPSLPTDDKAQAVQALTDRINKQSLGARIGQSARMQDSEPDDNDEVEFTRVDMGPIYDQVDEYNGMVQQEINRLADMDSEGLFGIVGDFVKTMIPFYEQGKFAGLVDEIEGGDKAAIGKALTLMGSSKQDLRDTLMAMPPEDRTKVAQQLIKYVKESNGPQGITPNKMVALDQVRSMLETGGYGSDDKFIDNVVSVLDDTLILSVFTKPITKLVSGASDIARATKVSKNAKQVARRYEEARTRIASSQTQQEITIKLEQAKEAVGGALTNKDKSDLIDIVVDDITDTIYKGVEDVVPSSTRVDIRQAVENSVGGLSPVSDVAETVGKVNRNVPASISKRMIDEAATEASQDAQTIFRSNATRDYVKSSVQPSSVSQVYRDTNPRLARSLNKMITDDETGQLAKAGYGTNTSEALAHDHLPEISKVNGVVKHKVSMDESFIKEVKENTGAIHFTKGEKAGMRSKMLDDWRDVNGVVPRTEMSTIEDISTGARLVQTYGPRDGGFKNAQQAKNQVAHGLRKYGVLDSEMEVMVRDVEGYRPATAADDLSKDGDYLIQVKHDYEFTPGDTRNFDKLEGGSEFWRLFDVRLPGTTGKAGGLTQHFIPSSVTIDRTLLNSASVAADKTSKFSRGLFEMASDYAKKLQALKEGDRYLVESYIVEANAKRLKFDPAMLEARGMSSKGIDTVRQWRKVQDTLYVLNNMDYVKGMRAKGFEMLRTGDGSTELLVKPMSRNQVAGEVRVFNPETGKLETLSRDEVTKLYDEGGQIAQTRDPLEIDDDVITAVSVRQDQTSFTRMLRDEDTVLNYIDGYYHVAYDSPYFIVKKIISKDGREFEKAIGTVSSRQDAEVAVARLRGTDNAGVYRFRDDVKKGTEEYENLEWSNAMNMGQSSQRVRGERLVNMDSTGPDMDLAHIATAEESLVKSIQTVANRAAFRDWLEASKARFLKQFEHLLDKQGGVTMWPENVNLIGKHNAEASIHDVKNAIATWRYIDSIESGFVDVLSDASKSFFKNISDLSGRAGWKWIEKLGRKGEQFDPNQFARRKSFRMLLSSNPVRQLIVQPSQAFPIILSLNPTFLPKVFPQLSLIRYMKRGGDINSYFKGMAETFTGLTIDEAKAMAKHYKDSGIEEAIDSHTYMREDLHMLNDRNTFDRVGTALDKPLDYLQKIGFERGEKILMTMVWLSEYDKLRRAGTKITREVLDELSAKIRNLTGNMNRAGEMPYNQNALSGLLQFQGTPHKIFSQVWLGHSGLTTSEIRRLRAGYLLTFGTGAGWITDQIFSMFFPDMDKSTRAAIENGMAQLSINTALSNLYGKPVETAISDSLRIGITQPNLFEVFSDLLETNLSNKMFDTPSGTVVKKVDRFMRQLVRPFTEPEEQTADEVRRAGLAFLDMFSGASNFMKAKYILENEKAVSSSAKVTGRDLHTVDALMRLAGFSTMDEVRGWAVNEKIYKKSSKPHEDIEEWMKQTNYRMSIDGISNEDAEYALEVMREANRVWGGDPFYMKIIVSELRKATQNGETQLWRRMLKLAGFTEEDEYNDIVKSSPLSQEEIDNLIEIGNIIRSGN